MARGALAVDPSTSRVRRQQGARKGALATNPVNKWTAPTDAAGIDAQIARAQKEIERRGGKAPNWEKRLQDLQAAKNGLNQEVSIPPNESGETPANFESVTGQSNAALQNTFNQIANQGAFNPQGLPSLNQDYSAMRQKAEQMAMDSFNRQMNPQFQREEAEFRQRMAEQGIPESSAGFQQQYQQMRQAQDAARQNAMTGAFQAGQGEQAQAFGQAMGANAQMWDQQFQGYQLPMAQLNALTPFYGAQSQAQLQQGQQQFAGEQAELDRNLNKWTTKYNRQTAWGAPRGGGGGGGMSFEQQMALQDRDFWNRLVANGMANGGDDPRYPSAGSQAAAGFAAGALGAGLR